MKKTVLALTLFIATISFSQKIKVLEGSVKNLKGITQFDLEFDYTNVQIPHYNSEEEFLKNKVAIREKQKKGKGIQFRKDWFDNRKKEYEPMFIKSFNKWYNRKQETISNDAEYLIKIKVTNIFSGFNVVALNQYSKISAIITITKKSNPNIILYKGKVDNLKGGKAYDLKKRISYSYFHLAKVLSIYILRKS